MDSRIADMAPLVSRMRRFLAERDQRTALLAAPLDPGALVRRFGFAGRKKGTPEVILSEDVFVELGHPRLESESIVLITFSPGLVKRDAIFLIGPDLDQMSQGEQRSFAQVVLLAVDPENIPDPFDIENTQYLMHRLPGYMVRSMPGRLWARVSKKGRASGLTFHTVGCALLAAYIGDFAGVLAAEVVFVTSNREDVRALEQIRVEANILSGKHKKLVLGLDGEIECTQLNCDSCEEKPVCDNLRDIVIKRRDRRREKP